MTSAPIETRMGPMKRLTPCTPLLATFLALAAAFVYSPSLALAETAVTADQPSTSFTLSTKTWDVSTNSLQAHFRLRDDGVFEFLSAGSPDGKIQFLSPGGQGVT